MDKKIKILLAILGLLVSSIVVLFIVIPSKIRTSKIKPKAQIREKISSEAKQIKQTKINTKDAETIIKKIEEVSEYKTEKSHVVSETGEVEEIEEQLDQGEEIEKAEVDLNKEGEGFEKIETEEDIWFWNEDMIKRWNKEKEEFTYYWVEVEWQKLWGEKHDYYVHKLNWYLDGNKIDFTQARELLNIPSNVYGRWKKNYIYLVNPPKFELKKSEKKPNLQPIIEDHIVKNSKTFIYQKRDKFRPYFGKFSTICFDKEENVLWIAILPFLEKNSRIGTSQSGKWWICESPPHEGGIFQLNCNVNQIIHHTHASGIPTFKEYKENDYILKDEALKYVLIENIYVKSNEVEFFLKDKRILYFDKINSSWNFK